MRKRLFIIKNVVCLLLLLVFFSIFLSSCGLGGLGDWSYSLPNNYAVWRINGSSIDLCLEENHGGKYISAHTIIESYVAYFCYNDRYVGVIRIESYDTEQIEENYMYYLVDTQNGTKWGEMNKQDYLDKCAELGITDMCDWIPTVPTPKGAK